MKPKHACASKGAWLYLALGTLIPAVAATSGNPAKADEVVELSPFVIKADDGWIGGSSLVGNRTNKSIADLPHSVDAITRDFMQDLGAFTLEDAAMFVSNLVVTSQLEYRSDDNLVFYRGMELGGDTAQSARNFFNWYSPTDNYNIERIDFNKGSNSLMFGDASPGGQAATYTKRAQFRNFNQVTAVYGSFKTYRLMLDVNRKLNDKLALRLNYLNRSDGSYIKEADSDLRALHLAVTYQPFKNTQIRVEAERGIFNRTAAYNQVRLRSDSAPGLGFNAANRWFITTDGTMVNRTPNFTNLYPAAAARDTAAPAGLILTPLEGMRATVRLLTTSAPTSATPIVTGRTVEFSGPDMSTSYSGFTDDWRRPYGNGTLWLLQNVGKMGLEMAYNNQQTRQQRNDGEPTPTAFDANGRAYFDRTMSTKDYGNRVETIRGTISYPLKLGNWMTQYVVLTGTTQRELSMRWVYHFANLAVMDGGASNLNVNNNQIVFRAYLDDPDFGSHDYWNRISPGSLEEKAGFRPGWYRNNPNSPVQVRYSKSYSASSAGEYFGGRLHSLFGLRFDSFKRKFTADNVLPLDRYGQGIFPGFPDEAAPGAYVYDQESDLRNTCYSSGLSYTLFRGLNLYGNHSTSFRWQGTQLFTGENPGPVLGKTYEAGIKASLFKDNLFVTMSAFQVDRENAIFIWGGGPANAALEELFSANDAGPGDPDYFELPVNNFNNQSHTTLASERSRGVEATFQLRRIGGVQARFTLSHNEISAARDFTDFKRLLDAAIERTNSALAPGGNPAMAEVQADIVAAQNVVRANDGGAPILGNRSTPWSGNWLVDYEFGRTSFLKGTRVAVHGSWRDQYNMSNLGGTIYRGSSTHPVGAYAIHRRKVFDRYASFRLGMKNIVDLENPNRNYRRSAVIGLNPDGTTINQYRYIVPFSADFTVTLDF